MASSTISICNRALQILGTTPITSLDDANNRARNMAIAWDPVRTAELRRRIWSFAITRITLAALADKPDSDYTYQYQLPNGFVRLAAGGDLKTISDLSDFRGEEHTLYVLEGGKILTELGPPLAIRYVQDVTDPRQFDAAFAEALACRLAYETCSAITESTAKEQAAALGYKEAIIEAKRANALELPPVLMPDNEWVSTRIR